MDSIIPSASWGVKIHQNREAIIKATEKMFYNNPHKMVYCHDQVLLNEFLWPIAINDSVNTFILYFNINKNTAIIFCIISIYDTYSN